MEGACYSDADKDISCRPAPPQGFNALALRDGFLVPEFDLTLDETGQPTFVWTPPARAELVSCAVFRCPPIFAGSGETTADGLRALQTIYNFASCALIHRVVRADKGSFVLARQGDEYPCGDREPVCEPSTTSSAPALWTKLTAGCWAYDFSRVVEASTLISLRPDQVAGLTDPAPSCDGPDQVSNQKMQVPEAGCDGSGRRGKECYAESTASFGTCLDGECRPRCVTALDCELATTDGTPPDTDAGVCAWECLDVENGPLGVCSPLEAAAREILAATRDRSLETTAWRGQ